MIKIIVKARCAWCEADEPITSGSVGLQVRFRFDDAWSGLEKVAVFQGSGESVDVFLTEDTCAVPGEVLATPGSVLTIGVYGTDGTGELVIPTIYAEAGRIFRGAEPSGVDPEPPTPSLVDQILAACQAAQTAAQAAQDAAEDAEEVAQSVRDDADSGAFDGEDGAPGRDGTDGVSPTLTVSDITGGHRITITDASGTRTVDVMDGATGPAGADGAPGADGYSPTVSVTNITGGHRITITDANGTRTVDVMDGATGADGAPGAPGADGYSPTVSVTDITGGHRVTITDKNGAHSFDVMDGQGGSGGTSDYSDLTNKPKINGVTLEGNKTLAQIGAGTYSKPSGGIPKTDLESDVQSSLGKADTALQQHQSLSDYRTASAQDLIDQEQDAAIAGKLPATGNAYRAASIPMGHLDATSTATVMTAQVPGITELRDGVCVWLTNGVIASASGVTLNVNGLGAKPIYNSLTGALVTTTFTAASAYLFVYNSARVTGGCWDMVYGYDTNTTYTPVKLGFGYTTCSTAEATAAKTAALSSYTLTANGIVSVKFTNAVGAGATLNINSKGAKAIHYRGAAITDGIIKAGDTATFIYSTYYHLIAIDRANPTKTSELTNDSGFLTQHQDISGKQDKNMGSGNAGKFLVVGSDGNITAVSMSAWQGGSY